MSRLTDAKNCGACGNVCPEADNALGVCLGGECATACKPGYASCDGDPGNGCEVKTSADRDNCSFCGNVCPGGDTDAASCVASQCTLVCQPDRSDCNKVAADGCEVDTSTDPLNCGSCGVKCGGTNQCTQGACQCAGTSAAAVPVQLSMYIMLDKSGSMLVDVAGSGTRWAAVKSALNQFFASPEGAGIKVALNFFPLQAPSGPACEQGYYYTPAVSMSSLPGAGDAQKAALTSAMESVTPSGGTPTQVALTSALKYASDWKTAFPQEKTIVVLATDGQPGDGCGATVANSSAAADAGFKATPSVPTYVIGVGPDLSALDAVAQAGGTTSAFLVNDGNTSAFLQALKQIKQQAVACEFALPTPTDGASLDADKVNFEYTPGGGQAQVFSKSTDASACAGKADSWYYDDPTNPTKILLCPATCSVVQGDTGAKVNILLGCATKE
ncbi:MAG: VWA domain-containing protein [Myxococcales bacterium]|nr:MAG: VWA domain-containing protein [Myxococcales bacterium]